MCRGLSGKRRKRKAAVAGSLEDSQTGIRIREENEMALKYTDKDRKAAYERGLAEMKRKGYKTPEEYERASVRVYPANPPKSGGKKSGK